MAEFKPNTAGLWNVARVGLRPDYAMGLVVREPSMGDAAAAVGRGDPGGRHGTPLAAGHEGAASITHEPSQRDLPLGGAPARGQPCWEPREHPYR
jgi:hypothetical protein